MNQLEQLQTLVDQSTRIVFFGGAGVSTESGIPDFRSADGIYRQKWKYPPEEMVSRPFFDAHPDEFFEFYRQKLLALDVKPNAAHHALARLEQVGKLTAVVTQNIDGLHHAAGSSCVYELHGSVHRNSCMDCKKMYSAQFVKDSAGVPRCTCGGIVKPDVVLFGEALDDAVVTGAVQAIGAADLLIVGGTSLAVYPAAGLLQYRRGRLALINRDETPYDSQAEVVIHGKIGETLAQLNI